MNLEKIMDNLPIILALVYFFINKIDENEKKKINNKKEAIFNKEDSEQEFNIFQDIKKSIEEDIIEFKKENLEEDSINLEKDVDDIQLFPGLLDIWEDRRSDKSKLKEKKSPLIGPKYYNKKIYTLENAQDYYKETIEKEDIKLSNKKKRSKLEQEDLLRAFILSEVFSEPKSRRR